MVVANSRTDPELPNVISECAQSRNSYTRRKVIKRVVMRFDNAAQPVVSPREAFLQLPIVP